MEKLEEYMESVSQKQQFLDNHDMLLQSLLLSKQNAGNQPFNQEPQGIGNESFESSQGISEPGGGETA
jgi:hypothetical protein